MLEGDRRASSPAVIRIRQAAEADAECVSSLLGELGYVTTPGEAAERLRAVAAAGACTLVAEIEGVAVGFASVERCVWIHRRRPVALLTALVVNHATRGRGVGRALVAHVEAIARAWDCESMELTSNDRRSDAHRFYAALGFESRSRKFVRAITR